MIKSLAVLVQELQKRNISQEIELGRSSNEDVNRSLSPDEEEVKDILSLFLQHSNEVVKKISSTNGGEEKLKSQIIQCLNGLRFCVSNLMRETIEIEKEIKELLKWENPTR